MGPGPTLIYLLRHGAVVGAETRRFVGHLDPPLSPEGERQCATQARRLATTKLAAVFSSDLKRAYRSAEIVAAAHGLTPIRLPALREMSMGRWEGLTATEIERREPAAFADWTTRVSEFPFPDGESVPDLAKRAWPVFEAIAHTYAGQSIAVIAHGGTNRVLLCQALAVPLTRLLAFGQDYAALSIVERSEATWVLRRLNERPMAD